MADRCTPGQHCGRAFPRIDDEVLVWTQVKRVPNTDQPATGVAIGHWQDRTVIAIAHMGCAEVFDLAGAQLIGSPKTKRSQIVTSYPEVVYISVARGSLLGGSPTVLVVCQEKS